MLFVLAIAASLESCCRFPASEEATTPQAVPEALLEAYAPKGPSGGLALRLEATSSSCLRYRFSFHVGPAPGGESRRVEGYYYRTRRRRPGERAPLLLLSPILAGPVDDYLACRFMARRACAAGFSAFFLAQEEVILAPGRDAAALEERLRRSVRDNRRALTLLTRLPEVAGDRLGAIGVSLGGIKNVVLAAVEPRLKAHVLCLAGADLPDLLLRSREGLVRRYLEERARADGLAAAEVADEFRRELVSEPSLLAPAVGADRVLLYLARFDAVIPWRNGVLLRERLGNPELRVIPSGHYGAVLFAPWMVEGALAWLRGRLGGEGGAEFRPK